MLRGRKGNIKQEKKKKLPEFLGSVHEQSDSFPGSIEDFNTFFRLTSSLAFFAAIAAWNQQPEYVNSSLISSSFSPKFVNPELVRQPYMLKLLYIAACKENHQIQRMLQNSIFIQIWMQGFDWSAPWKLEEPWTRWPPVYWGAVPSTQSPAPELLVQQFAALLDSLTVSASPHVNTTLALSYQYCPNVQSPKLHMRRADTAAKSIKSEGVKKASICKSRTNVGSYLGLKIFSKVIHKMSHLICGSTTFQEKY